MDPASIAGLLLQTSQLAVSSGTALYQFLRDAQNVNGHVKELAIELESLSDACKTVRDQLQSLARQYRCNEGDEDTSLWSSIKEKLDSCNATLQTLNNALTGFRHGGSNFVTQGVRQFKLNLRQHEIIAMKGRIHSHTSALQVCLLVMDIKVSHLASRKVGTTLGKKLNKLEVMIKELKTLLESQSQPQPPEEQSLLDFEDEEDAQVVAHTDHDPVPELVRVDSVSSIGTRQNIPERTLDQCIDSDEDEAMQTHGTNQAGDDPVLQCAQETLSRATSLYEESLYEGSVGDASIFDRGSEKQLSIRKRSRPLLNGVNRGKRNHIEIFEIPKTGYPRKTARALGDGPALNEGGLRRPQTPAAVQILHVLTDEPLNMPSQIETSFRKLQGQIRQDGSSTMPMRLMPKPWVPVRTLPRRGKTCDSQGDLSQNLVPARKRSSQHIQPRGSLHAVAESSIPSYSTLQLHHISSIGVLGEHVSLKPLRYLDHIDQDLEDLSILGISQSRQTVLEVLHGYGSTLLPVHRVALIGRLGIGKSYIAAAHVLRLIQRFETVPIFWISVSQLENDCKALSALLQLKCPKTAINPWNWLSKIIASLPRRITEPWLVVLDGVNIDVANDPGLQKLLDIETPEHGYLLMTTRHRGTANIFLCGGLSINIDTLNGEDAGNMLASKSPVPRDFEFDVIAQAVDFDPFVAAQVSSFLEKTGIPFAEFSLKLKDVLDDQSWAREGQATVAAKALSRKQWLNDYPMLVPVIRAVLNPSWLILFDALHEKHPAAAELLSVLSVFGRTRIPEPLLAANAGDKLATGVLLDQCFLMQTVVETCACRLMLIAHRVWLIEQDEMEAAFREALKKIANEYPAVDDHTTQDRRDSLEPFVGSLLCNTASSWIPNDRTSEMYISMLKEKRKKIEPE